MKRFSVLLAAVGMVLATAALTSCEKEANGSDPKFDTLLEVQGDGASLILGSNLKSALVATAPGTALEQEMLTFMKEEEKLARDVYTALSAKWGTPIFANIAKAEATHASAVVTLMERLGMANTALLPAGEFENPAFTALYAQLVADGSRSLADAFRVGALIEEKDIFDLKDDLTKTSNANITMVFENLLKASSNHLRAFNRQLTSLGIAYSPTYLDWATFTQIVTSPMEQGRRYQLRFGQSS